MADQHSIIELWKMLCVILVILYPTCLSYCILPISNLCAILLMCVTRITLCGILCITLYSIFGHNYMSTKNVKDKELHEVSNILEKIGNNDNIVKENVAHDVVEDQNISLNDDNIIYLK